MIGWGFALALLLTPAIAMQISHEWNWGPGDFLVAALLIGGVGLGVEWGVRRSSDPAFRIGAAMALVGAFLLAWINAVAHLVAGRDHPANLLVLMIPLAGLALGWKARWRPVGLTRVLLVMTAAQLLLAACVAAMSSIKHARCAGGVHHALAGFGFPVPPGRNGRTAKQRVKQKRRPKPPLAGPGRSLS
jgi:hypothetical protein